MSSTSLILPETAAVVAQAATWKAISLWFLLAVVVMVAIVLVKIIRLVMTGRSRPGPKPAGGKQASVMASTMAATMAAARASADAGEAASPPPAAAVPGPPAGFGPGTPLRSLRLTMSAAAFLVPMAMAVFLGMILASATGWQIIPSENPFGIKMLWRHGSGIIGNWAGDHWENFFVLVFVAICLAGHVGLLRAAYANRSPSSADFFQGIKDHTFTFILGKLLLCLGVVVISGMIGYRVTWTGIFFVVPSLLLAPLIGTAALHPKKPAQAIKAALAHSTNDVHGTGKLVTIQVLMMLGAWIIYSAVQSNAVAPPPWDLHAGNTNILQIPLLANGVSTLSFNTSPMMPIFRGGIGEIAVIAFTVISSTVFLGCHFLKVMDTVQERAAETSQAAAGQVA